MNGAVLKAWNNKFGNKSKLSKVVSVFSDENNSADAFVDHFAPNHTMCDDM